MPHHVNGKFEVKVAPTEVSEIGKAGGLGRMTIDKVFSGPLEAKSQGEMLTGGNAANGAMAYVALETVRGTLEGKRGSFVLSHRASMLKSDPRSSKLEITIVPSSGTDELMGIEGFLDIQIVEGQHHYALAYDLPES